tara:strand:+ start:1086 stop:1349 length:264 start_codon:yes stop_codon:yes gene_type:complete
MGRAIDMEKDIDALKIQVKRLEDIVRGMTHTMDGLSEKSTTTEHIDLVDDVKVDKEKENGKKADNKRSSKSSGSSKGSNNKSRNSSK